MPTSQVRHLGVYLHLAQDSLRRRRPLMRDRMLVLAAAIAANYGLAEVAAYCREEVLRHNPRHLLGRWQTVAAALGDGEFQIFLRQVRRRYPTEKAERLLESRGLLMAREREAYYSDAEYAAAILGTSTDEMDRLYGPTEDDSI